MKKFSKFLGAAVVAGGLFMSSQASALTNIGGIIVDESDVNGFNIGITSIFETIVTAPGQELSGIGVVTSITQSNGTVIWADGQNGKQLTFMFDDYFVDSISPTVITFTGGKLTVYVDNVVGGTAFDVNTPSTAIDGTEWLNLVGHPGAFASDPSLTLRAVELGLGDFTGAIFSGAGTGLLDVAPGAGLANTFWDTDGFNDAIGGTADVLFGSNFDTTTGGGSSTYPLGGSANIRFSPTGAIPEPMTAGLGFMSLAGLAMALRRRR